MRFAILCPLKHILFSMGTAQLPHSDPPSNPRASMQHLDSYDSVKDVLRAFQAGAQLLFVISRLPNMMILGERS